MAEIVVGYDGTDGSKAALDQAVGLAKELGDKVVIAFGYWPPGYAGGATSAQREAIKERGEQLTAEAAQAAKTAGVDHEVALVSERPADALSDLATQRGARMIVIGSHGEGPIRGAILGATAYRLVHTSKTPVLVIRG